MIKCSPQIINNLKPNEIFVFGSNEAGIHGAGAAKLAYEKFGAIMNQGIGLHGKTYAIPTKNEKIISLSIPKIQEYVNQFIEFAAEHRNLKFLVTLIGCGLAGFTPEQIAPLFKDAIKQPNIYLPQRFINILNSEQQ